MTTVSLSRSNHFQYRSAAALATEIFCSAPLPQLLDCVVLSLVYGYNASGSDRFFQLAEAATPGQVPLISIPVPAGQPFSFQPAFPGFRSGYGSTAAGGFRWMVSSTGPTYTVSADTFWVNAIGRGVLQVWP